MQLNDPWLVRVEQILLLVHNVIIYECHGCPCAFKQRVVICRKHIFPRQAQQLAMQWRRLVTQVRNFAPQQFVQCGAAECSLDLFR